jgi:hypothetical protein
MQYISFYLNYVFLSYEYFIAYKMCLFKFLLFLFNSKGALKRI